MVIMKVEVNDDEYYNIRSDARAMGHSISQIVRLKMRLPPVVPKCYTVAEVFEAAYRDEEEKGDQHE